VLHHLAAFAPDKRNAILLCGFQAGGTRGADLARGVSEVKIHGGWVPVRARVENLQGLSAHADAEGLLAWLGRFERPPARIFLTHGEPDDAEALRRRIARAGADAQVPEYLQAVELGS
jgi:metallo-beta-lactamase family protein